MNEGFGKDFYRKGHSVKRLGHSLNCRTLKTEKLLSSSPSRKSALKNTSNIYTVTLKTLTSLNKEVRPFFLGDNSIWRLPSPSSLNDYSSWRS